MHALKKIFECKLKQGFFLKLMKKYSLVKCILQLHVITVYSNIKEYSNFLDMYMFIK